MVKEGLLGRLEMVGLLVTLGMLRMPRMLGTLGILVMLGILIMLSTSSVRGNDQDSPPFPWDSVRLPTHLIPLHYHLLMHPNLTTLAFAGTAAIQVRVQQETTAIILHSKRLQIVTAAVDAEQYHSEQEARVLEHQEHEQVAILPGETLRAGHDYTITIHFLGNLSDSLHGFYKSTYRTQEGKLRVLAATHFEPTAARMAFPCFDEPAFKARFSIRIRREPKHLALSNMPVVKSVNLSPWLIEDQFNTTVKMSTYLIAFIVSDFKSLSKITSHGVKISVYTAPDKIDQADYALDSAVKLLDFYEEYFSIPYPLPKQDLAAIPDFQSGAMENWGLTMYRESALLYDPEKSSTPSKLWITMIIAHELAHQWFGNLVTMEWWNDLWLNEGFAKFMEFVSVSATHPQLTVEDYFLSRCFNVMEVDALNSSHPVSTPVEDPAQILEMFDEVSYNKGSCILNMLRHYLTPGVFKAGLVHYLQKYSYKNTKNEDLWNSMMNVCLAASTGKNEPQSGGFCRRNQESSSNVHWTKGQPLDVKAMMDTWTLQKGFPVVSVAVRGKNVHVQQERYVVGVNSPSAGYLWHIPLTYITSNSDTVQRFLMTTKADVIILPEEVEWVKFNVDMNGYYIVHYEDDGWDRLIKLLKENHTMISSSDRASLVNNIFQLVRIKKLSISKALELTLYLKHERQVMPVLQGLNELIPIYRLMEKRDVDGTEKKLQEYIVSRFKGLIDEQAWSDKGSMSERLLRHSLLLFSCLHRYQPCVDKAKGYFMQWRKSNGTLRLPADVKAAVYAVGAQTSDGWDFLLHAYSLHAFSLDREDIKVALSFGRSEDKLWWLMDQGLHGDTIRTQDLPLVIVSVAKNPRGHHLSWMFLKENWEKLVEKFELGSNTIASIVTGVTSQYSTRSQLAQVKEFFSSLEEKSAQLRCVHQAIETIKDNIEWMDGNFEKIKTWLQNNHQ